MSQAIRSLPVTSGLKWAVHQQARKMKNMLDSEYVYVTLATLIAAIAIVVFFQFTNSSEETKITIPKTKAEHAFGIDVSHYQGLIIWEKVKESHHPIEFVFIRSTMGRDGKDLYFNRNWEHAQKQGFLRGAYHYFRPNESGQEQFENFKRRVKLEPGDLPPVVDVEEQSKKGNSHLIDELNLWIRLVEEHYGVKPILYTGHTFYRTFLKGKVDGCPLWIADYNYGAKNKLLDTNWSFHQFSDKVRVSGIGSSVDGNNYAGKLEDLKKYCLR
jgi:lysozyme